MDGVLLMICKLQLKGGLEVSPQAALTMPSSSAAWGPLDEGVVRDGLGEETYKLLKKKAIYEILDGDTNFKSKVDGRDLSLPYQTGPMLVDILNRFGDPITYGSWSRWQYVEELMEFCIKNNRVSDLLSYLFSLEQFRDDLRGLSPEEISAQHEEVVQGAIDQINGELFFGGHELKVLGGKYIVAEIGVTPKVEAPSIKAVDRQYVKDIAERAQQDIENGELDSALTKARTLLEEVFIYVIERKGEQPNESGDIGRLYKQVKSLYNMHGDANIDRRVNTLLSGLEKIVSAVSEMRNKNSDAHGVGANRLNIADYHARLAVNAATNMADFILSVATHANK